MNPLTLVKRIQNINKKEANLGISEEASWHAKYKDSAYVFVGGIPFDLTEGDLLAVFAQYGEIVDVNLIRDKGTGKSKGFAFLAYEDQRSTNLAVDNLNGAQILGRIIRVDHVNKYKKMEEEDEETRQQKREERGVCRAFAKGECNRGDSCKFSHNEQRAANTGWGAPEDRPEKLKQDKFEGSRPAPQQGHKNGDEDSKYSRAKGNERSYEGAGRNTKDDERRVKTDKDDVKKDRDLHYSSSSHNRSRLEPSSREHDWKDEKRSIKYEPESHHRGNRYGREREDGDEKRSRKYESEYGRERDDTDEKRSRKYEPESYRRDGRFGREREDSRSGLDRDTSTSRHHHHHDHHRRRNQDE